MRRDFAGDVIESNTIFMNIERFGNSLIVEVTGKIVGEPDEERFEINATHDGKPIELTCFETFESEEKLFILTFGKLSHAN